MGNVDDGEQAVSKTPKYLKRVVPPLSDGRTIGVCKHCGKQHPPAEPSWDSSDRGCEAKDAVYTGSKPFP